MILELAKIHMGKMFYFGLKRKFGQSLNLLYTDTDSFVCSIRQKNWMQSLKEMGEWFDFSNLDIQWAIMSHDSSRLHITVNVDDDLVDDFVDAFDDDFDYDEDALLDYIADTIASMN